MQGNKFIISLHLGTLGADLDGVIPIPFACSLLGVSLVGTNNSAAIFDIGIPSDPNGILSAKDAGDSSAAAYYGVNDFDGDEATPGQPFPLAAESELEYAIDYDGAGSTAIQEAMLMLWFSE